MSCNAGQNSNAQTTQHHEGMMDGHAIKKEPKQWASSPFINNANWSRWRFSTWKQTFGKLVDVSIINMGINIQLYKLHSTIKVWWKE